MSSRWRTSRETNGVCEFILPTFPILFRDIYGSGGVAAAPTYCTWTEGGGFHARITRDQRKVHWPKWAWLQGHRVPHPLVSILCQVPIRAVSRTALYNEAERGERSAWRKVGGHKVSWKLAYVRASYREHLANDREKNCAYQIEGKLDRAGRKKWRENARVRYRIDRMIYFFGGIPS